MVVLLQLGIPKIKTVEGVEVMPLAFTVSATMPQAMQSDQNFKYIHILPATKCSPALRPSLGVALW